MRWSSRSRELSPTSEHGEELGGRQRPWQAFKVHRAPSKTQAQGRAGSPDLGQVGLRGVETNSADAQLHSKSPSHFAQGGVWCGGTQGPLAQPNTPWVGIYKQKILLKQSELAPAPLPAGRGGECWFLSCSLPRIKSSQLSEQ